MPPPHLDPINAASGSVCIHLSPGNCMDPILTALLQSNEPLDDSQARHVRATLDATMTVLADLEGQISKTLLYLVENERCRRSHADTLKGVLSPIRRIPSEILVEIFLACRENSLTASNYSITDPREAPMLMGHVSSRWRQICHGAPRLWNHFHLSVTPGSSMDRTVSQFRPILTRSGILPLHVDFQLWCGSPTATENLFDLIFQTHERLKSLCLCITQTTTYSDSLSRIFSRRTPLPVLSSITLIVDGTFDATRVLALFLDMNQLRDVHLDTHPLPPHSLLSALPWAQLTRLELRSKIELGEAKEILVQCAMLQECALYELSNDEGLDPPQYVHQLVPLQRFAITIYDEVPPEFLEAFSFPNLLYLDISATTLSHNILVNLLAGSKFSLEGLKPDILTYDPGEPVPSFALPQLTSLTITNVTDNLDGRIVADMVESVCAHAGGQNLAFPALATVELDLDGPSFSEDVEYRIAAASVIGPIKVSTLKLSGVNDISFNSSDPA
ncbi:hypothetical protein FB451DRAFT_1440538 [Mycena latifolia]|nr:hypothetical protein FB451DRAFT_1440538 [Mycena latifolia]